MDSKELIEVLERIADALEGISSEVKLLPAPLEEICGNTGCLVRLGRIANAAEIWTEQQADQGLI